MNYTVDTERLILRPIKAEDAQDLFELDNDPEVHRFLGNNPVMEIEKIQEIIKAIHSQYKKYGIGRFAVELKETGEMVGWSGLKYETGLEKFGNYYDLGYRLKRAHWGKGIAYEAAIASLNFGFDKLDLEKICAGAHIDNGASNHLLKKLGFTHLDDFAWQDEPCYWYELEKEVWAKR